MRNEISKLPRNLGSTTIYVTHDQVEAMTMARPHCNHERWRNPAGWKTDGSVRTSGE